MLNGIYRGIQYVIVLRRVWRREDGRRLHIHRREMRRRSLGARPLLLWWYYRCCDYCRCSRLSLSLLMLLLLLQQQLQLSWHELCCGDSRIGGAWRIFFQQRNSYVRNLRAAYNLVLHGPSDPLREINSDQDRNMQKHMLFYLIGLYYAKQHQRKEVVHSSSVVSTYISSPLRELHDALKS